MTVQLTKHTAIISFICLFACACMNDVKSKYHYYEHSLKAFVLSTRSISEADVLKQMDSIVLSASEDSTALHQTLSYLEFPFSDPNSSFRSQTFYQYLLKVKLNSRFYNNNEKKVAQEKLTLLRQNNIGSQANDFVYITPAGYKRKMYSINAPFTLLYFNNPECNACKEMKTALTASPVITSMIDEGELKVLSIYTDADEKLWLESLHTYPIKWIEGRDEDEYINKNKVYDLRAIPTLYLLDSQKRVLLKDALSVKQIEIVLEGEMNKRKQAQMFILKKNRLKFRAETDLFFALSLKPMFIATIAEF